MIWMQKVQHLQQRVPVKATGACLLAKVACIAVDTPVQAPAGIPSVCWNTDSRHLHLSWKQHERNTYDMPLARNDGVSTHTS